MATIQLYQHQSQLHSQAGPRANAQAFGAAQAQALAQVSEQIGQLGQKLADTADYRALTEYQLEEQDFQAKQEKWLLDNPHAKKDDILKRYKVERDAFNQSQLKKKDLSRRAREQIGLLTQEATVKGERATTYAAHTREIKRAQAASDSVISRAVGNGDLETAITQLDADIERGIKYPEQRETLIQQWTQTIQRNEVMRMVNTDPMQAKEMLEERDEDGNPTQFDQIDEATRYTLINHAERNFSQLAQNTFEDLATRIDGGEVIGSKELDDLVGRRMMSDKQARAILKMQSTGKFDPVAYAELHSTILAYDPALDKNTQQHAQLLGSILAIPPEHATELRKLLAEKQKGSTSPLNSTAAKEEFKAIKERFNSGFYGNFIAYKTDEDGKPVYDEEGKRVKAKDHKLWEEARARQVEVEEALSKFLLANPKATRPEIAKFVREYQTTEMTMAAFGMLSRLLDDEEGQEEDED